METTHTPLPTGYNSPSGYRKPKNADWRFAGESTPWHVVSNDGERENERTQLIVDSEGRTVAECRAVAFNDAPDVAVRAVNSHDLLVDALKTCLRSCQEALSDEWDRSDEGFEDMESNIEAALKSAGVEL